MTSHTEQNACPKDMCFQMLNPIARVGDVLNARVPAPPVTWASSVLPALLDRLPHPLGVFLPVVLVEVRRLDVCRRARVWVVEKTDVVSVDPARRWCSYTLAYL